MYEVDVFISYDKECENLGPFETIKQAMRAGNKAIKQGEPGYASYDVRKIQGHWKPVAKGQLTENLKVKTEKT